ncbi:MAG: hypothetical protein JNM25_10175 [Planctomycetes bacterium]|nr:hypothetical protein [Planctomycetota bacterium]
MHTAIEQSGLIGQDEVDRLVDKSRQEFRSILKEREAEVQRAHEIEETLAERETELAALKSRCAELTAALASKQQAPAATGAAAPSGDLVMSLMQEMANMKASLMQRDAQPAPAAGAADFSAAIEKLAGSLNDRLETIGKKMGVSAAVESNTPMDFSSLFADDGKSLESNMENIEVKQKSAGGIAGNLARLKKLKGGS